MSTKLFEATVIEPSLSALALEAEPMKRQSETHGSSYQRRDLKTSILHADEELYQKQLEAKGGKEDMWQGGDIYYPNPPKIAHDVTVEDIGGREQDFTLDNSGFFFGKHAFDSVATTEDLGDTDKITKQHYPEMEKWLKEATGAPRVLIFNHATRISTSTFRINDYKKDQEAKKVSHQAGVFAAHLDQSSWQAINLLHRLLPEETEGLLQGRVMIVNAWRPIKTVYRHPFGVASASSVPHTDVVVRRNRIFKDINESMGLKYSPEHRWYYKFAQQPDEILVFKQFDNYGKVRACPHTAFKDEEFEDREPRESIEIRAMLFWPDFYEERD